MAISRVGTNSASGTSVTIPAHQAGDLIILVAYRRGSSTPPSLAAGSTNIISGNGSASSLRVGYKVAAGASETSGTWTSATSMAVHVYRGASGIGDAQISGGATTQVTYPALTFVGTNPWVMGVGLVRDTAASLAAPTGMTNQVVFNDSTISRNATHDTNGTVASWSIQTVATGVASTTVVGSTIEILAAGGATLERSASVSATGDIQAAGVKAKLRSASLDASASLATSGLVIRVRSANLDATGSISASGTRVVERSASLDATGSIEASGEAAGTVEGSASFSATGSIASSGFTIRECSASLTGSAEVSASAITIRQRSASLSASGSIQATAIRELQRSASLQALASLQATGDSQAIRFGSASLSATGSITAIGNVYPIPDEEALNEDWQPDTPTTAWRTGNPRVQWEADEPATRPRASVESTWEADEPRTRWKTGRVKV